MRLATPIVLHLLALAGVASAQPTFHRIGLPPGEEPQNPAFSNAMGVSNDGVAVGDMYVPNVGFRSFRWTVLTGIVQINGLAPTSNIFARVITPDGSVVAGENTNPQVGFRLGDTIGLQGLNVPNEIEYDASAGNDVSDNGAVVAGLLSRVEDGTFRAARWTSVGGWQDLGALVDDYESAANAISGDGSVLAGYSVGNVFTAVRWDEVGGLVALPNPFGIQSSTAVIAMSGDAGVLVGQANDAAGATQAAVWRANGTTQLLPVPAGYDAGSAFGVSADGGVIGGTAFLNNLGADIATYWIGNSVIDLRASLLASAQDVLAWTLLAVTEVSPNGRYLVGRGINPDGALEGFFVDLGQSLQCDSIDFNNDGSLFDPTDVDAFLSVFSEGPCLPASATCNDIDFNNDGSLFDPCDIEAFLLLFSEGPCTLCGV